MEDCKFDRAMRWYKWPHAYAVFYDSKKFHISNQETKERSCFLRVDFGSNDERRDQMSDWQAASSNLDALIYLSPWQTRCLESKKTCVGIT